MNKKKMMSSALNELSQQHSTTKRFLIFLNTHQSYCITNINTIGHELAIQNVDKFAKNNPKIAVKVLLSSKNSIHTAYRSECHGKCSKQANLLMIVDEKNRRTTAIKNFSRLLKSLNATHKGAYHFYMNCFNSSCIALSRNKHYEY